MPSIAYVVARSHPQHVIGCENKLPWRLRTDIRFFRSVTEHHAIIMGRRTFDSIGHPLADRVNIVLSRHLGNDGNNLFWVNSREDALFLADFYSIKLDRTQLLIIGGAEVYKMYSDLVNKVFLTEVFSDFPEGDAFFHESFDRRKWNVVEERNYEASDSDQFPFKISVLERRMRTVRQRDINEFLTEDSYASHWERSQVFAKASSFEQLPDEQFELPIGQPRE